MLGKILDDLEEKRKSYGIYMELLNNNRELFNVIIKF